MKVPSDLYSLLIRTLVIVLLPVPWLCSASRVVESALGQHNIFTCRVTAAWSTPSTIKVLLFCSPDPLSCPHNSTQSTVPTLRRALSASTSTIILNATPFWRSLFCFATLNSSLFWHSLFEPISKPRYYDTCGSEGLKWLPIKAQQRSGLIRRVISKSLLTQLEIRIGHNEKFQ